MGVRGLKTFIENNPDLVISDYKLQDTHLIIDANNVKSVIFNSCHDFDRADLCAGDLVRFANSVKNFLANLVRANVTPIFVFDGAKDVATNDKTAEQLRRCKQRHDQVAGFYNNGFIDIIMPRNTSMVFNSILHDHGFKIIACMYEADNELARLSNHYKGPILSNDSDFLLMNLNHGVISFDTGEFLKPIRISHRDRLTRSPINCRLFTQDRFVQMFPGLNKLCLPILGVLAGNDYVTEDVFEKLLSQLPSHTIREAAGLTAKQFKQRLPVSHQKILKVLYFMCDKTPEEAVNQLCSKFSKDKRAEIKQFINKHQKFYDIPAGNEFRAELRRLCLNGSKTTFKSKTAEFELAVDSLTSYIISALEQHSMSFRILEIMNRNVVTMSPAIEDLNSPNSSRIFLIRIFGVMLRLLRTHKNEQRPIIVYDRVGRNFDKTVIKQICDLEHFGTIDFLVYDLVGLSEATRLKLLLATFYCSEEDFDYALAAYRQYFNHQNAYQAVYIKLLLNYVDKAEPSRKLSHRFKRAIYTAFIYYIYSEDATYQEIVEDLTGSFIENIGKLKLDKPSRSLLGKGFDFGILHQLSLFSAAINGFHLLTSLLAEPVPRIRIDAWLNNLLVYRLIPKPQALHDHEKTLIAFD